jgi:hypothetical protein
VITATAISTANLPGRAAAGPARGGAVAHPGGVEETYCHADI